MGWSVSSGTPPQTIESEKSVWTVACRTVGESLGHRYPFPAGAEHPIEQGMAGTDAWSQLQFLDDRASFFVQQLPAGQPLQLHYALDLTTAGRYTAPPPTLTSVYGPPVRALGEAETITIDP